MSECRSPPTMVAATAGAAAAARWAVLSFLVLLVLVLGAGTANSSSHSAGIAGITAATESVAVVTDENAAVDSHSHSQQEQQRGLQLISQLPVPQLPTQTAAANADNDIGASAVITRPARGSNGNKRKGGQQQQHQQQQNQQVSQLMQQQQGGQYFPNHGTHNHDPNNEIYRAAKEGIKSFVNEVNAQPQEVRGTERWRQYKAVLQETSAAGGAGAAAAATAPNAPLTSTLPKLPKTAFSPRNRLLFVMGLEGSGHHAVSAMMKICNESHIGDSVWGKHRHNQHNQHNNQHGNSKDNDDVNKRLCEPATTLSRLLMHFDFRSDVVKGLYGAADVNKTAEYVKLVEVAMQRLAHAEGEHLFFVGLGFTRGSGMFSYPNYNAQHKALDHPDALSLALMAESVGLDLRILVLQRSGYEIISSTVNRNFGNGASEGKILIDNAAAMLAQIQLLSHDFFKCVKYRDLGKMKSDEKEVRELADFIHPENLGRSGILPTMLDVVHYSISTTSTSKSTATAGQGGSTATAAAGSSDGNGNDVSKAEEDARQQQLLQQQSPARSRSRSLRLKDVYPTSDSYHAFHLQARIAMIEEACAQ